MVDSPFFGVVVLCWGSIGDRAFFRVDVISIDGGSQPKDIRLLSTIVLDLVDSTTGKTVEPAKSSKQGGGYAEAIAKYGYNLGLRSCTLAIKQV